MKGVSFMQVFIPSVGMMLVGGLVALFFSYTSGVVFFETNFDSFWNSLLLGAFFGVGLFVFLTILMFLVRPFSSQIDAITIELNTLFSDFNWLMIVFISLVAGIGEELIFRGLIQRYLADILNPFFALLLASMLFGLCHYLNRLYVFIAFAMGLVIGGIYHVSGDLLLVMVLHAVYDFFAFTMIIKYPHLLGLKINS